jgi:hypothetical protein
VYSLAKHWLLGAPHRTYGEKHLPAGLDEYVVSGYGLVSPGENVATGPAMMPPV